MPPATAVRFALVPPLASGKTPATSAVAKLTALDVKVPLLDAWTMPVERPVKSMVPEEVSCVNPVNAVV